MPKTLMRKIVLAAVVAVLPAYAAAERSIQPLKPTQKPDTPHPVAKNPCAQYGGASLRSWARIHALRLAAALASKAVVADGNSSSAGLGWSRL